MAPQCFAHRTQIARETEVARGIRQAFQMQVEVCVAIAIKTQGFDQIKAGVETGDEARLQQALRELVGGGRIEHDAAADSEAATTILIEQQGTDRHIEAEIAVRLEPSERAGVQSARRRFDLVDDLHAAQLGRAGYRAARKQGSKNLSRRD